MAEVSRKETVSFGQPTRWSGHSRPHDLITASTSTRELAGTMLRHSFMLCRRLGDFTEHREAAWRKELVLCRDPEAVGRMLWLIREQIAGIVFLLQREDQPVVICAKCGACLGVGLLFERIDIGPSCHERAHGVPALARPRDISLGLGRFGPARQHQEVEPVLGGARMRVPDGSFRETAPCQPSFRAMVRSYTVKVPSAHTDGRLRLPRPAGHLGNGLPIGRRPGGTRDPTWIALLQIAHRSEQVGDR